MLKRLIAVIVTCVLLWSGAALAEIKFDISVFENDPNYEVEFDEMDDTGTIQFAEDSERSNIFMGTTDDEDGGMVIGFTDIRIAEGFPPSVRLSILYMAEDWAFIDEFIIIAGSNRYTFGVDCEREVLDDGNIMETFVVVLTDESIGLLEDIANSDSLPSAIGSAATTTWMGIFTSFRIPSGTSMRVTSIPVRWKMTFPS